MQRRYGWIVFVCSTLLLSVGAATASAQPLAPSAPVSGPATAQVAPKRIPWLTKKLSDALDAYQAASAERATEEFERVLDALPRLSAKGADGETYYIVEGDLPSSHREVCEWIQRVTGRLPPEEAKCRAPGEAVRATTEPSAAERAKLRELRFATSEACGKATGRKDNACLWTKNDRGKLSYHIDWSSFPDTITEAVRNDFEAELKRALEVWTERFCAGCGLKFAPAPAEANPKHTTVRYDADLGCTYAVSFFPYTNMPRALSVGDLFFSFRSELGFEAPDVMCNGIPDPGVAAHPDEGKHDPCGKQPLNGTGGAQNMPGWCRQWRHTLLHEVGHMLGYHHEQLVKDDLKCDRQTSGMGIGDRKKFDEGSIMHSTGCAYEGSTFRLRGALTTIDRTRHLCFYSGLEKC